MAKTLSVDYLVIGAGAMGMAFVDTMLTDNKEAKLALVDRYDRPGGHWTRAYPFVRLHQPSLFYGVNSKPFEQENTIDQSSWNQGLFEMATGDEVVAYYSQLKAQRFLPSGRVQYFGNSEYIGEGTFKSIHSGQTYRVDISKTKIVDATYMQVIVPSMRPPPYKVAADVTVVSVNDLARVPRAYYNYTVVGAGKTGIDACLWLLANNVPQSAITWIIPRDGWLFNRKIFQPGTGDFQKSQLNQFKAIMTATSAEDLLDRLGEAGCLVRLDAKVKPTMFHCGTVSEKELEELRKIENVVRKGRVVGIESDRIVLEKGTHKSAPDTLYIDCTANGLARRPAVPVFQGNTITLQPVRVCQQVFSAAFIAHVEATVTSGEAEKNDLCEPVPHPEIATDWLKIMSQNMRNMVKWLSKPEIATWVASARLDYVHQVMPLAENLEDRRKAAEESVLRLRGLADKMEYLLSTMEQES